MVGRFFVCRECSILIARRAASERMERLAGDWLPQPRNFHLWPNVRFAVKLRMRSERSRKRSTTENGDEIPLQHAVLTSAPPLAIVSPTLRTTVVTICIANACMASFSGGRKIECGAESGL